MARCCGVCNASTGLYRAPINQILCASQLYCVCCQALEQSKCLHFV